MKMFKKGDLVRFRGRSGQVLSSRIVRLPDPLKDYRQILYSVKFSDGVEWVNSLYLVKEAEI